MLTSGQLLAERYRLGRRIAVGGMGEVWEAEDARLDRKVAVKVLKPELCGDAEFLHRFRIEARTTASLNHPGIAAVHDYGETAAVPGGPEDTAYLVMELVEGEPLAGILARERVLTPERTLDVLEQAGHALQAAHERALVHRDVKPGNILVTPAGQVKITDFGIAKAADAAPVTRSGMVMGTAHYIAPEQAVGQEAEPASDVYSLAVVGYECLVGHRPFLSENAVTVAMMHIRGTPPPLPPHVPPGLRALIEATLVKDPRRRYQTGGEFAGAVAAVRAGRPLPLPSSLLTGANLTGVNLTGANLTGGVPAPNLGASGIGGPHTGVNIPAVPHPAAPLPAQIPQQSPQPVPQPPQPVVQPQVPQQQVPQSPPQAAPQGTQPGLQPVPHPAATGYPHPLPRRLPVRRSRAGWWALGAVVVTAAVVVVLLVVAIHAGYLGRPAGQPDAIRPVGVGSVAMPGRPGNAQRWIRDGITGGAATWIERPGAAWQVPRPTPARYAGHPTGMMSSTQTRSGTTQR